ncbi:hypothetical protein ACLNAL_30960 [Bacillus sp. AF62]|uniref:hypothetical protein n=1 Tax=Bacillus sp. AF62 TaxID=3158960 RepID=UPI00398E8EC0
MKYHTKKYEYIKFPDSILKQVLNLITHIYKEGTLYLTLFENNNVKSYKDLDTFFNDYNQNNFITNIEYLVHGIQKIKITFNMYHTNISMLYCTALDSHIVFDLFENYNINKI